MCKALYYNNKIQSKYALSIFLNRKSNLQTKCGALLISYIKHVN